MVLVVKNYSKPFRPYLYKGARYGLEFDFSTDRFSIVVFIF